MDVALHRQAPFYEEATMWRGYVKLRGRPKGRPRVTKNGHTYMPKEYMAWREEFGWLVKSQKPPSFSGSVELHLGFHTDGVQIVIIELDDATRPKYVQADLDNLVGGVMEVLEDVQVLTNDKQVVRIVATCYEGTESRREKEKDG